MSYVKPGLLSYPSDLFCHSAQIPIKNDEKANNAAMEKVRNDKLREVKAGHDGT